MKARVTTPCRTSDSGNIALAFYCTRDVSRQRYHHGRWATRSCPHSHSMNGGSGAKFDPHRQQRRKIKRDMCHARIRRLTPKPPSPAPKRSVCQALNAFIPLFQQCLSLRRLPLLINVRFVEELLLVPLFLLRGQSSALRPLNLPRFQLSVSVLLLFWSPWHIRKHAPVRQSLLTPS